MSLEKQSYNVFHISFFWTQVNVKVEEKGNGALSDLEYRYM